MARSGRRAPHVQKGPPAPPPAPAAGGQVKAAAPRAEENAATPGAAVGRRGWGWGVAFFLWATAFGFLLLYELLEWALRAAMLRS